MSTGREMNGVVCYRTVGKNFFQPLDLLVELFSKQSIVYYLMVLFIQRYEAEQRNYPEGELWLYTAIAEGFKFMIQLTKFSRSLEWNDMVRKIKIFENIFKKESIREYFKLFLTVS